LELVDVHKKIAALMVLLDRIAATTVSSKKLRSIFAFFEMGIRIVESLAVDMRCNHWPLHSLAVSDFSYPIRYMKA
jgi:hypothetical protein